MKRNRTLDLHFHPSSGYSLSHDSTNDTLKVNKQLHVILHNRRHTFDITELQARMIIWLAKQEMEQIRNGGKGAAPTPLLSMQLHALLVHLPQGISIKRSIGSFLQKRKKRSQSHVSIATHNNTN